MRLLTAAAISTPNSSMDITYKRVGTFNSFKDVSSAFGVKNGNNHCFSDSLFDLHVMLCVYYLQSLHFRFYKQQSS